MIQENPKASGTWWVTDPLRPGAKVCLRRLVPGSSTWYVWTLGPVLRGRYRKDFLDALAVAQKMLEDA